MMPSDTQEDASETSTITSDSGDSDSRVERYEQMVEELEQMQDEFVDRGPRALPLILEILRQQHRREGHPETTAENLLNDLLKRLHSSLRAAQDRSRSRCKPHEEKPHKDDTHGDGNPGTNANQSTYLQLQSPRDIQMDTPSSMSETTPKTSARSTACGEVNGAQECPDRDLPMPPLAPFAPASKHMQADLDEILTKHLEPLRADVSTTRATVTQLQRMTVDDIVPALQGLTARVDLLLAEMKELKAMHYNLLTENEVVKSCDETLECNVRAPKATKCGVVEGANMDPDADNAKPILPED